MAHIRENRKEDPLLNPRVGEEPLHNPNAGEGRGGLWPQQVIIIFSYNPTIILIVYYQ